MESENKFKTNYMCFGAESKDFILEDQKCRIRGNEDLRVKIDKEDRYKN